MTVKTIVLDLAKDVLQVHGVFREWARHLQQDGHAREASAILRVPATLRRRHGGVRVRPSLRTRIAQARP